jgi:hypothetical protein
MQKEMTAEQGEQYRPRVILDLKIVINRGDVPIISGPYGEVEDSEKDEMIELGLTEIKRLREENRILTEKLSGVDNA